MQIRKAASEIQEHFFSLGHLRVPWLLAQYGALITEMAH